MFEAATVEVAVVLDEVCVFDAVEVFEDEIEIVEFDIALDEVLIADADGVFEAEVARVEVDLSLVVVFFLASRIGASLATTATILPASFRYPMT
jgi:hypothetical protein